MDFVDWHQHPETVITLAMNFIKYLFNYSIYALSLQWNIMTNTQSRSSLKRYLLVN